VQSHVANRAGLKVFWVPTDVPIAFEKLEPLSWAMVSERLTSGRWAMHSPLEVWWHGVVDDLGRFDASAAHTARGLDSEWLPFQLVFPLLEAWAARPVACAPCDPARLECVDCCSRASAVRTCSGECNGCAIGAPFPSSWSRDHPLEASD
jgi:hypothetical protein